MCTLELTDAKAELLKEVVDYYLSELRMEIADTDSLDYREKLKEKKKALVEMSDGLGELTGK